MRMKRDDFLRSIALLAGGMAIDGMSTATYGMGGRFSSKGSLNGPQWYRDSYIHAHASISFEEADLPFLDEQVGMVRPDAIQFHVHGLSMWLYLKKVGFHEKHGINMVATINHAGTWSADRYDSSDKYSYRVNSDGSIAGRWGRKHLCFNSPGVHEEIIPAFYVDLPRQLRPSQVWIDEAVITVNVCYCRFCKALYREQYHDEPPAKLTMDNLEEWERWVSFHRACFWEWMEKIYLAIKSVDSNILVTFNHSYLVEQPEKPPYFIANLSADILNNPLELGINARYAGSGALDFDLMPGLSTDIWAGVRPKRIESVYNEIAIITAHGGKWNIGEFPTDIASVRKEIRDKGVTERPADRYLELARKGAAFARARQDWCQHTKPYNQVALLHSARTHYAHVIENINGMSDENGLGITSDGTISEGMASERNSRIYWPNNLPFSEAMIGAYEALLENHAPFDIINESQFQERIKDYRTVILAEQHLLDAETIAAIHEFVRNGGNLVASGRSVESGLAPLMGVELDGAAGFEAATLGGGKMKVSKSWRLRPTDGMSVMDFDDSDRPAIVKRSFQGGTTIYLAANVFDTYYKHSGFSFAPVADGGYSRFLLGSIVDELSSDGMIRIKANPWVESVVREKDGDLFLHFIDRKSEWKNEQAGFGEAIEVSLKLDRCPRTIVAHPGKRPVLPLFQDNLLVLRMPEKDITPHLIIQIVK